MFDIKVCEPDSQIEQYVYDCTGSLIYYSGDYISLVTALLNAEGRYLVAFENGQIAGVLPFIVKQGASGKVMNSMAYYGSNGGVVQQRKNSQAKTELIRAFYSSAQNNEAVSATIITNPLLEDNDIYLDTISYDYKDERIGQITHLDICEEADELIQYFESPRPRNIRKALKYGVEITHSQSPGAVDFLYKTHVDNMSAIGGLAKSRRFFDLLCSETDKSRWNIYLASIDGRYVAALLLFYFNNTVEYFTPVIDHDFRNSQALALIIFEAMKDAKVKGYKNWNWGGTWLSQSGVYNFKKKWATKDYPYYYYTKTYSSELLTKTKTYLLSEYPGMYVLPFSALED